MWMKGSGVHFYVMLEGTEYTVVLCELFSNKFIIDDSWCSGMFIEV